VTENVVLVERAGAVGIVTLNRPGALNALNNALLSALATELEAFDEDKGVCAIVLTGGEKVFAAGADLKQLADAIESPEGLEQFLQARFGYWDRIRAVGLPIVGAVAGYALGAGCELAMSCDLLIAAESARFGQPELNVGLVPGAGGTQRLARVAGKVASMEMLLTGRMMSAREGEQRGMVNRVVPTELLRDEALALATEIAVRPREAVRTAKQAVLKAFELPLSQGLAFERDALLQILGTPDAREGISAFLEKRTPSFHGS
jgi:enoyl-CoA hydratase